MHEKTKQALHQASIDDTMKSKDYPISTQEAFLHGADGYRNLIWHDIQEEPDFSFFILLYDEKGGFMSPASRWPFKNMPGFVEAMNRKYGAHYNKWAYLVDILPDKENE